MRRALVIFAGAGLILAQTGVIPLSSVRPDDSAVARTVFRGTSAEEFPVQILGILRQSGPGQNLILGRLLTPRLEQTGVMQGMSGSPVYIGGRLAGAIAFAFPFAKEPIAGIRPIEEMLAIPANPPELRNPRARLHLASPDLAASLPIAPHQAGMPAVATPISFAGLSAAAVQHFAEAWRTMGFALQQGASGTRPEQSSGDIGAGDMISVQLMRGDMSVAADGTVTHREGDRILAFGHRFLGAGSIDFPFAKSEVVTSMPNFNTSFKISQSLGPAGAIVQDADAGVVGMLGRRAAMSPLRLVWNENGAQKTYGTEIVRHTVLSPLLVQMAVFSMLDHHGRSAGPGSVDLDAAIRFKGLPDLRVRGRYVGDSGLPILASLGAAIPLAYVSQQEGEALLPESIDVNARYSASREQWTIDSLRLSRRSARPGTPVTIELRLASAGKSQVLTHDFVLPSWLHAGETLTISVNDSLTANLMDFRSFYQPGGPVFGSHRELIETLNRLHPAGSLYLRAYRSGNAFLSGVQELGSVPHSIGILLSKQPGQYPLGYQSKLLDREFTLTEGTATGSKTVTLEIEK